jgi:P27 family predicted phage terminase small subunit
MAIRGTKPTPTTLKLLRGTARADRMNPDEPKPRVVLPEPPADLLGDALEEWHRSGEILERLGLLTESDVRAFESYCRAWGRYKDAERAIATEGTVIKAPSGYPVQNPQLGISNKELAKCMAFWSEFGMMPASRTRVRVQKGAAPPKSKLNRFMKKQA